MVFHRANPANFEGPGGQEYDPDAFQAQKLRAELAQLAFSCCLEHGARIADKLLEHYSITSKHNRKYP